MKKSALLGVSVAAALWAGVGSGAEGTTLKVSGTVRVRYEFLDGQFRPGFDSRDDMLPIRSTLLAEWRRGGLAPGGRAV